MTIPNLSYDQHHIFRSAAERDRNHQWFPNLVIIVLSNLLSNAVIKICPVALQYVVPFIHRSNTTKSLFSVLFVLLFFPMNCRCDLNIVSPVEMRYRSIPSIPNVIRQKEIGYPPKRTSHHDLCIDHWRLAKCHLCWLHQEFLKDCEKNWLLLQQKIRR